MGKSVKRHVVISPVIQYAMVLAGLILMTATPIAAEQPTAREEAGQSKSDSNRLRDFHTRVTVHSGG
jgi:hypothetical protein